jgi:hypothetical protein
MNHSIEMHMFNIIRFNRDGHHLDISFRDGFDISFDIRELDTITIDESYKDAIHQLINYLNKSDIKY